MLWLVLGITIGLVIGIALLVRDFLADQKRRRNKDFDDDFRRLTNGKKD